MTATLLQARTSTRALRSTRALPCAVDPVGAPPGPLDGAEEAQTAGVLDAEAAWESEGGAAASQPVTRALLHLAPAHPTQAQDGSVTGRSVTGRATAARALDELPLLANAARTRVVAWPTPADPDEHLTGI